MNPKITYSFTNPIWKHSATGGWYFVSVPKEISQEIRDHLQWQEEGWGRMKAFAKIKGVEWETAIWFDTKKDTYILPLKAEIRKKTGLRLKDTIEVSISL